MSQNIEAKRDRFPTFRQWRRSFPRWLRSLPISLVKRTRAWWKRNFRRLAFACLFLVALWTGANIYATFALNRELNAIKQRGEPLTLAQLNPRIADADNALPLYSRAFAQLKYKGDENLLMQGTSKDYPRKPSNREIVSAREKVFERNRNVTTLLFQAAQITHFQLPPEPLQETKKKSIFDMNERQKLLSHQREFARFMGAQAEYEAKRGNTKAALRCITTIYRMSDQIAQEPNLIAMLVAIACEQIGHSYLARVLDVSPLPVSDAQKIALQLPHSNLDSAYNRALQYERIFMLRYYSDSRYW